MSRTVLSSILVALGLGMGTAAALIGRLHPKDAMATSENIPKATADDMASAETMSGMHALHSQTMSEQHWSAAPELPAMDDVQRALLVPPMPTSGIVITVLRTYLVPTPVLEKLLNSLDQNDGVQPLQTSWRTCAGPPALELQLTNGRNVEIALDKSSGNGVVIMDWNRPGRALLIASPEVSRWLSGGWRNDIPQAWTQTP
ncbi:MAG: hypothetical protein K6T83_10300 [Alicyclobacillus sp.]|nr:hypothetical protein [Alicyclobacillus sp.]